MSVLCQFGVSFVSLWSFRDMIWLVFLWNGTALLIFSAGSAPLGLGFCCFGPCLWAVFMLSAGRKPLCRCREHITSFSPFVQKRDVTKPFGGLCVQWRFGGEKGEDPGCQAKAGRQVGAGAPAAAGGQGHGAGARRAKGATHLVKYNSFWGGRSGRHI